MPAALFDASEASNLNTMDFNNSSAPRSRTSKIILGVFVFAFVFVFISTTFFAYSTWKTREPINLVIFPSPDVATIKVEVDGNIRIHSVDRKELEKTVTNPVCSETEDNEKFNCHPESDVTEDRCLRRGCCWKSPYADKDFVKGPSPLAVPACWYPSSFNGYYVSKLFHNKNGITATLTRNIPSGFPKDVQELRLDVTFLDEDRLRFRITDANSIRYEVPVPIIKSVAKGRSGVQNYDVQVQNGRLTITRKSSGVVLVDANLATMIYSDQLLQLDIKVPTHGFYGLGEAQDSLLRGVNWKRYVLFARDRSPEVNRNLYGTHPFYIQIEKDFNSHGLFLLNSNLLEIITQPTPGITFRPLGGVFDFYVMLGPTPADVVKQYQDLIGRPIMPPYWSLGFHLCRWGYNSLENTKIVWQRNKDAGIPFDVQWNDIDYMDHYNDFTYNKKTYAGLPEFVEQLHNEGMHYVMIMDVGVSGAEKIGDYPPFDDGIEMDIFVKNITGDILYGHVWNDVDTVYPDFTHPRAGEYFAKQYKIFYDEVKFDGAWIDMNEPSNLVDGSLWGCPGKENELEYPYYIPQDLGEEILHVKTICMSSKHYATTHYNVHNIHGFTNGIATNYALKQIMPDKRPFIISRSTFVGQGFYTGHWSGDTHSTWEHLKWSIPSTLNMAMFGFSMMGTDICGFTDNTTKELCARWQALGAFYPFSRNHNTNGTIDQDPAALGPPVINATIKALTVRYRLLPYLYTLFHKSHAFGETVFRPIFFEFVNDVNTHDNDNTFLWGPAFMVAPILEERTTKGTVYLPDDVWYDYYTGALVKGRGSKITITAELDHINLFVRGGYILPAQTAAQTTTASRKNHFELIVALKNGQAVGDLYWDDGETADTYENKKYTNITFNSKNNALTSNPVRTGYQDPNNMLLGRVDILGVQKAVEKVTINGVDVNQKNINYNPLTKFLSITGLNSSLLKPINIVWS